MSNQSDILDKATLYAQLVTDGKIQHGSNVYYSRSSGSTSQALYFPTDVKENHLQRAMLAKHFREQKIFSPESIVMNIFPSGHMYRPMEIFTAFSEHCEATVLPLSANATEQEIFDHAQMFGANTLMGMPSRILTFARYVHERGLTWQVDTIVFGGEFMQSGKRAFLSEVFGTKRFCGVYGSAELGIVAYNADMKDVTTYEVANEILHIEILNPDADGFGALIGTNLVRKRFPIVRYNTGDVARILKRSEATTTIELKGRKADSFLLGDEFYSLDDFAPVTSKLSSFQFQLHFDATAQTDVLKVLLVEGVATDRKAITAQLQKIIGSQDAYFRTKIEFTTLDKLSKSPSGNKIPAIVDRRT